MNKDVLKAINALSKKINDLTYRISAFFDSKTDINAFNIESNADGVDELGEATDATMSAMDELAELYSMLEERVSALEEK
jgi:methyl-accepting chemotaxis protein